MHDPAVRRVLRRRAHREFVAVGLAGDQRACRLELGDRGRLERRAIALEDPGAARRREFERADVVLHRDGHAVEHAGRPRGGRLRLEGFPQLLRRRQEGVEALGFEEAVRDRFSVTHSNCPSLGTTKKPSLNAGANSSGPPVRGAGFTSSARKRIASGDRKSTRLNSSHSQISYAVFCLKKKKKK